MFPFSLDKDERYIHTGNETEGRRWLKVGTINKATNYEQWTIGNGPLIKGGRRWMFCGSSIRTLFFWCFSSSWFLISQLR
jgi:hypothetical protein